MRLPAAQSALFIILVSILSGCATVEKVKLADEDFVGKPISIKTEVPFVEQTPSLCGPTALYMVAKLSKPELDLDQVKALTFSPGAKGTYKQDLLSGARRLGLAPYQVASLHQVFDYLAEQTPVLIFHQTDFLWQNYWHFSVLTGYDRAKQTFAVHIGNSPYRDMDISQVVKTWKLGGEWAYVIFPAGHLPKPASFEDALANSLAFIRLTFYSAAVELAEEMQKRWPEHYEADLVLADAYSKLNRDEDAVRALHAAYRKNPQNAVLAKKIAELKSDQKNVLKSRVN